MLFIVQLKFRKMGEVGDLQPLLVAVAANYPNWNRTMTNTIFSWTYCISCTSD